MKKRAKPKEPTAGSSKPPSKTKPKPAKAVVSLRERIAGARELEEVDRVSRSAKVKGEKAALKTPSTRAMSLRNSDYPRTYIKQISVRLEDPDHPITLTWTGPQAEGKETGPFRSSPGAGLKGLNCDDTATSRRSGSKCTPKGTFSVSGFQQRLNSDSRATYVTWFVPARGIALHYFPSVPEYPASHGCVRLDSTRVAQLIQSNSRINLTKIVIDGTWTKPPRQW